MRRPLRTVPQQPEELPDGPTLSPAEFARALTELHRRPSLQSLCDATAHLGSAALGRTWAVILSRSAEDEPLRPVAEAGPDQERWPVEPPAVDPDALPALFARIDDQALAGETIAAVWDGALPAAAAAALQDALRPQLAAIAAVVVEGRRAGVVFIAVDGDVPPEAVIALVAHAAAAACSLLQLDRLREKGDSDGESGVLTGSALDRTVAREVVRARRYGRPLSLVAVRPEQPGPEALTAVGRVLQEMIRETDFVARLDDLHLAALLPETDREGAESFLERVLERLPDVRVGCANYPVDGSTWDALLSAVLPKPSLRVPAPASRWTAEEQADAQPVFDLPATGPAPAEPPPDGSDDAGDVAGPPPRPAPPERPAYVVGALGERFPQHAGPPPRLRDVFPNFSRGNG